MKKKAPVSIPERELSTEQLVALLDYADRHGDRWKDHLSTAWMTGHDIKCPEGWALRQIRNQFGPEWLQSFEV
jgi:hypothetical protein